MSTKKDEKSTDKKVMAAMDEMKAVVAAVSGMSHVPSPPPLTRARPRPPR